MRYITASFSSAHSLCVFIPPQWDRNLDMHLLSGTELHRRIRQDSKEFKENLLSYAIADVLRTYFAVIITLFQLDWNLQHFIPGGILMPLSLLMYLKAKLVVLLCMILSVFG
jgi:hypothetical protein